MAFSEVKLFQVKPDRVEAFEELIKSMQPIQATAEGCQHIRYMKRFHVFDDIKEPPRELTRIVKCVKFYSFWEFDTLEHYHEATKAYFDEFYKPVVKLLLAPFDINCGEAYD